MDSTLKIETMGRSSYRLFSEIEIPRPRDEVFAFFANAHNLEKLTPAFLHFQILTPGPIEMAVGAKIDYQIRLHGIPVRWRTNICLWQPDERFADEQIRGPYRRWHHEHVFLLGQSPDAQETTIMQDIVHYSVWLGRLFHPLVVRRDLMKIFAYRQQQVREWFSQPAAVPAA